MFYGTCTLSSLTEMAAALVFAIPIFRLISDWLSNRNQFRMKNLEFFYQCFESESNKSKRLVVEQQFKSVFRFKANFDVIEALLLSKSPSQAIQSYKKSQAYVVVEDMAFVLREKYLAPCSRRREYWTKPTRSFIRYFVTAMLSAYAGFFFLEQSLSLYKGDITLSLESFLSAFLALVLSIVMALIAYFSITDPTSIKHAEDLVCQYDTSFESADLGISRTMKRRLKVFRNFLK